MRGADGPKHQQRITRVDGWNRGAAIRFGITSQEFRAIPAFR